VPFINLGRRNPPFIMKRNFERCKNCGHRKDKHNLKENYCKVGKCKCKKFEEKC